MTPALVWVGFVACAAAIAVAGALLTRYADAIAALSGLSRSWVGLALVAVATSLPELFAGLSSVTVANAPNIAVGDIMGSCVLNLTLLVLLDAISRQPVYSRLTQGHALSAGFGVILIGFVGALLLLGHRQLQVQFLHFGGYVPLILVLYAVSMRITFRYERRNGHAAPVEPGGYALTLGQAVGRYLGAAAVVAVAGSALPFIGVEIAHMMGWQTTFVGTLLIAAATSLPEIVVTIAAVRLNAVELAIAGILGSNLFDVAILAVDDLAYRPGPLLWSVSPAHAISAFAAVIMSGVFIVASLYQPSDKLLGTVSWVSVVLLLIYLASSYAVFVAGS